MELKTPITSLKEIDTETKEGRLLFTAIAFMVGITGKTSAEIILILNKNADKIFEDDNTGGHITKRSTGAIMETPVFRTDATRKTGNPDLGD